MNLEDGNGDHLLPRPQNHLQRRTGRAAISISATASSFHRQPVLAMGEAKLRGFHNAENLMAALAVGHRRDPKTNWAAPARVTPRRLTAANLSNARGRRLHQRFQVDQHRRPGKGPPLGLAPSSSSPAERTRASNSTALAPLVAAENAAASCSSAAATSASWQAGVPCEKAASLADAVRLARARTRSPATRFFFPGTSSFDMFKSYKTATSPVSRFIHDIK